MTEYTFKILVIGPAAVGKSSLIRRFVDNEFSLQYKFTIGVDFMTKNIINRQNQSIRLTIWDIGGQDRFKVLLRSFYDGAHGAIVVFDLSRPYTYLKMKDWISDMYKIMQKRIPIVILGNKLDLISEIGETIDRNELFQYTEKERYFYLETSAKTGENVENAFTEITQRILDKNY
ncbi:MAG: GTP-binding protein [Promethearchaeota archaeon]